MRTRSWVPRLVLGLVSFGVSAGEPTKRFVESSCAAVLALSAKDTKLLGQDARDWARTLPPGPMSFATAQRSQRHYVQLSVLTGDEAAVRLNAIRDETDRLNQEASLERQRRHRDSSPSKTFRMAMALNSAVTLGVGLVLGPESWTGATASVVGVTSAAASIEAALARRRYLGAPGARNADELIDLQFMRLTLEQNPADGYAATFGTPMPPDLIAACRIDGQIPVDCLVDAIDDNVIWHYEMHALRPAMEVVVHLVLSGSPAAGPILTTVVYFGVAQPPSAN